MADLNFNEAAYLDANPDVAAAVARGVIESGFVHYEIFGRKEGRPLALQPIPGFDEAKAEKLERLAALLDLGLPHVRTASAYDFLTDDLRDESGIDDLGPISSNQYDGDLISLFERHREGWVLDVGAGRRTAYYPNVVNYEIAPFPTTDVRGVAESLPFKDGVFDAVMSVAVLEHVRDPFRAAAEMVRVLKPGGELLCSVPFLQPFHGYPHHYYNMTREGLRNLFDGPLHVDRITVPDSTKPIWSLTWILRSWVEGLPQEARTEFLEMRVGDLLDHPLTYLGRSWVRGLGEEKNFELASGCVLFAHKPHGRRG